MPPINIRDNMFGANSIEAFLETDIYRYIEDNRPIGFLLDNDVEIQDKTNPIIDEVETARVWNPNDAFPPPTIIAGPSGDEYHYDTLDARLEDIQTNAGAGLKIVQFGQFKALADAIAARYASGFIHPVASVLNIFDVNGSDEILNPLRRSMPGRQGAASFGQILIHNEDVALGTNRVALGTGFDPVWNTTTGIQSFNRVVPLPLTVNGMTVKLFNEAMDVGAADDDVTWLLDAAPSSGVRIDLMWIEVWLQSIDRSSPSFFPYGAEMSNDASLTDPDDPTLEGNVGFWGGGGGDFFQLQHRLRIASVNPNLHPFGMSDTAAVYAQGARGTPVVARPFTSATSLDFRDPGLWIAGSGDLVIDGVDSVDPDALRTVDGYVYGIPVAMVFRRNTAQFTFPNPNGTSNVPTKSGSWGDNQTARADGLFYDRVEPIDVNLVAPSSVTSRTDLQRILDESFDRVLRGRLGTYFGHLRYDDETSYPMNLHREDNDDGGAASLPAGPWFTGISTIANATEVNSDQFFDVDSTEATDGTSGADGFRRVFAPQAEYQWVGFSIVSPDSSPTLEPDRFISLVDIGGGIIEITLHATGKTALGHSAATIESIPALWWSSDFSIPVFDTAWGTTGSGTIVSRIDTAGHAGETLVGFVQILLGATASGHKKAHQDTAGQVYNNGATNFTTGTSVKAGQDQYILPSGLFITATHFYVADLSAHMVWKLNRTTFGVVAKIGEYKVSGIDNTHLKNPTAITVDSLDVVYIADTGNQRIIKATDDAGGNLVHQDQFGVTGVAGSDGTHLDKPRGLSVDNAGLLFASDFNNFRVFKILTATMTLAVSDFQFGEPIPPAVKPAKALQANDDDHAVGPQGQHYGTDGKIYVADTVRVLILDPTSMTVETILKTGTEPPNKVGDSSQALDPSQVTIMREDSSGNKYVIHFADEITSPNGQNVAMLTKYDSSWNVLDRLGGCWDFGDRYGGRIPGPQPDTSGLCWPTAMILDEARDAIVIFELNPPEHGTIAGGGVANEWQIRVHSIRASDFSLSAESPADTGLRLITAVLNGSHPLDTSFPINVGFRPWSPIRGVNREQPGYGGILVGGVQNQVSGITFPDWRPLGMEFDPDNKRVYVWSGDGVQADRGQLAWSRIEKWDASSGAILDIRTWLFEGHFGDMEWVQVGFGLGGGITVDAVDTSDQDWQGGGTSPNFGPGGDGGSTSDNEWRAWENLTHNSTRLTAPGEHSMGNRGVCMLVDAGAGPGAAIRLFVTDNHTVIKLDGNADWVGGGATAYLGRFGEAGVPGNDEEHLNFPVLSSFPNTFATSLQVIGDDPGNPGTGASRVYVADTNNTRLMILTAHGLTNDPSPVSVDSWDTELPTAPQPAVIEKDMLPFYPIGQLWVLVGAGGEDWTGGTGSERIYTRGWPQDPMLEFTMEPIVPEIPTATRDDPRFVDPTINAGVGAVSTVYIPGILSYPAGVTTNIVDVVGINALGGEERLFWADYGANALVAITNDAGDGRKFQLLGKAGTPGISWTDRANWNRPTAIAAEGGFLWFTDHLNGRIVLAPHYLAHVVPNTGRTEFLIPPELGSSWHGYFVIPAYQGVYRRGKPWLARGSSENEYPPITGRAILLPPQRMLVTTMGQGGLGSRGLLPYANCLSRLPTPEGVPDPRTIRTSAFKLKGLPMSGRPHYYLPVLNRGSNTTGEFADDGASFWGSLTIFSPEATQSEPAAVPGELAALPLRGGMKGSFKDPSTIFPRQVSPLSPAVTTFAASNPPNFRVVAAPFLVTVDGEVLLAVRVQGFGSNSEENAVGASANSAIELYRPLGHPMLKEHGEGDDDSTIVT